MSFFGPNVFVDITVEPPNKGHFGNRPVVICSEVVPISKVHRILIIIIWPAVRNETTPDFLFLVYSMLYVVYSVHVHVHVV